MDIPIHHPRELGLLIRAVRKTRKVRMDDIPGVGPVFVREVERGKETAQLGRVMKLLEELGIRLHADVPADVLQRYEIEQRAGAAPLKPRRSIRRSTRAGER